MSRRCGCGCGEEIPADASSRRLYARAACRLREFKRRQRAGIPARRLPAPPVGASAAQVLRAYILVLIRALEAAGIPVPPRPKEG